ncbi:MAG: hypothetical protein II871_02775 [Clostridia bacterium]|nr:hypothetical protein [Clostridia bacterium]
MKLSKDRLKKLSENPTFANVMQVLFQPFVTIIMSLLTVIFGIDAIITHTTQKNIVSFDSISSKIDSAFVAPKYVDKAILGLENPYEQLDMIATAMYNNEKVNQDATLKLYDLLRDSGAIDADSNSVTQEQLLSLLSDYFEKLTKSIRSIESERDSYKKQYEDSDIENSKTIDALNNEIQGYKDEIAEYKDRIWAELSTPAATVSGEEIDTTLRDYMAVIQSHNYYSEDFLNQVLPKSFVFEDNTIFYDKPAPEKVKVTSRIIYDAERITTFDGGDHFSMGLNDYHYGVTSNDTSYNRRFKIACNREYSKITFTLGHIDNTDMSDGRLVIYYYDNHNELKECKTIDLHGDMPILSYEVPIYNTTTVIFEIVSRWGQYGIADIYLVK